VAFTRDQCGKINSFSVNGAPTFVQFPQSINQGGDIAGDWRNGAGQIIAFVRLSDGTITLPVFPDATATFLSNINDSGEIRGCYSKTWEPTPPPKEPGLADMAAADI
jgi:hypothetical protein